MEYPFEGGEQNAWNHWATKYKSSRDRWEEEEEALEANQDEDD